MVSCHLYADDMHLNFSIQSDPKRVIELRNQCLEEVMGWMRANELRLSSYKTQGLFVRSSLFQGNYCLPRWAGVTKLMPEPSVCILAVFFCLGFCDMV